jgi:hypothetical protein
MHRNNIKKKKKKKKKKKSDVKDITNFNDVSPIKKIYIYIYIYIYKRR